MANSNEGYGGEAVEIHAGNGTSGLLLICDHASNHVPDAYGALGLAACEFDRHIAYDIGARDLTLGLAARFDATAILSRFSRLLIDPNRGLDDPTLIMRLSDGAVVPGNAAIDDGERRARIARFYRPYHDAIGRELEAILARGQAPFIFSVHSFTPCWKGQQRPWHAGILWDRGETVARALIANLRKDPAIAVGDNEPYSGSLEGDTLNTHGTRRGFHHALLEVRQDLIAAKSGVEEWVERVALALEPVMKGAKVAQPENLGVRDMIADEKTRNELEAAVFRRLVEHLRKRADVQNIDLMNLAGFCRNCLANWYEDAAKAKGIEVGRDAARRMVYGMPYEEWKAKHQREATAEQAQAFKTSHKH